MLDAEASPLWGTAKLGHLVHMPSHTFVRIGRWADAVTANVAAWHADVADAAACQSPYEPEHNTNMLVYAANMAGQVCLVFIVIIPMSSLYSPWPLTDAIRPTGI